MVAILAAAAVIVPNGPRSFHFLAGRHPIAKPITFTVTFPVLETCYAFRASYRKMSRALRSETRGKHWHRDTFSDSRDWVTGTNRHLRTLAFTEDKGYRRTVELLQDTNRPPYYVDGKGWIMGTYKRGWVGVRVDILKLEPGERNRRVSRKFSTKNPL